MEGDTEIMVCELEKIEISVGIYIRIKKDDNKKFENYRNLG